MDWNATTMIVLAAASLIVGGASLWLVRRQPQEARHLWREALAPNKGVLKVAPGMEPHVKVSFGEFFQVRRGGDETDKVIRYEATSNFRLLLVNIGHEQAMSVRAKVVCEGMNRPSWAASGWVDIAPGGERDVVLRSMVLPPLGPEETTWVDAPLRLEYQDIEGTEWFTETALRLKFVRGVGTDSYACWWVDVLEPQEHGRAIEAKEVIPVPAEPLPVAALAPLEGHRVEDPRSVEEAPVPLHDWVSPKRRARPGDAAAAAGA